MTFESTQPEFGSYGAKRQSWKKGSPRDLLKRIVDVTDNESEAYKEFLHSVREAPEIMDAIIEYWFANNYRSLTFIKTASGQDVKQADVARDMSRRMAAKAVETIKVRAERMVLLDFPMPNGKLLRDCTFKEVAAIGGKFTALSKGGKPNEKVGKLSETQVRKLFR